MLVNLSCRLAVGCRTVEETRICCVCDLDTLAESMDDVFIKFIVDSRLESCFDDACTSIEDVCNISAVLFLMECKVVVDRFSTDVMLKTPGITVLDILDRRIVFTAEDLNTGMLLVVIDETVCNTLVFNKTSDNDKLITGEIVKKENPSIDLSAICDDFNIGMLVKNGV